ncbi:bifunctional DNA primase/polymerase [Halorubrum vacuolatum]|uniref:Uncharacterized protein n=1 Tax=Halorubrum vacuolatum TaxID=63740 RepID=A0A238VYN8_HALVU|nr:hypothetical protein [Halorubrum vacuolatum]SNR39430.1 hypothetical protein SAMN06264855_104228 [Halorubrum vacuolatum]
MTISNLQFETEVNKAVGVSNENNDVFDRISSYLEDSNIYVPLEAGKKYPVKKGWNRKRNLITQEEAKRHLQSGGNVGLILGKWFNGNTYVLFDIEEAGILPADLKSVIDSHTVITHRSPHGGLNRIVRIEDREAYQLLHSYDTEHTDFREGPDADLELITSGETPLPPSEIHHRDCKDTKPCNGVGSDRYILDSINPEAPSLDIEAVRLIGDLLHQEEKEEDTEPNYNEEISGNVPSPSPRFNIEKEFNENVPSVRHTFKNRMDYMKKGDWEGQELFDKLYHGNFEDVSGSNKQGRAECKLANYIGFFFGNNEKFVRLFMDLAPFESYYEKYEDHRKFLLENATSVDWVYCEGVSFFKKYDVAFGIWIKEEMTTNELIEYASVEKDSVYRILKVLEAENMIEKDGNKIINQRITEGYLERLYNVIEKYEGEI